MSGMRGRFMLVALLALAANQLRFSNRVELAFDGQVVRARLHGAELVLPATLGPALVVEAASQDSARSRGGVERAELRDASGVVRLDYSPLVLFLFGRDLAGTILRADAIERRATWGDWTMDRFTGERIRFFEGELAGAWRLEIRFVGRGNHRLFVSDGRHEVGVHLNDGYLDNDFGLCLDGACPRVVDSAERRKTNLRRIAGFVLELALAAALLELLLASWGSRDRPESRSGQDRSEALGWLRERSLPLALALAHGGGALFFSHAILGAIPHVPDSAKYYRQAILLAQGRLATEAPADPAAAFVSNGARVRGREIAYDHSNLFWPALLAVGVALDAPSLVNPLLAGANVLLLFAIGRRLYDRRTALVAAAIYVLSPLAFVLAGDFMMHTATTFFVLAAIAAALAVRDGAGRWWATAAGASAAYAFGLRPLTALALLVPALLVVIEGSEARRRGRAQSGWAAIGAAVVLAFWCAENLRLTGSAFGLPLAELHGVRVGWSQLPLGLNHVDALLGYLPSIFLFLPVPMLTLAAVGLPLVAERRRANLALAASCATLVLLHAFVSVHGLHGYGPRFLSEGLFALALLSARAGVLARERATVGGRRLLAVAAVAGVAWQLVGFARVLPAYRNYNGIDSELHARLRALDLRRSVVLVADRDWRGMEVAATLFDPRFEAAVFVQEQPDGSHADALRAFPERELYRLSGREITRIERPR